MCNFVCWQDYVFFFFFWVPLWIYITIVLLGVVKSIVDACRGKLPLFEEDEKKKDK